MRRDPRPALLRAALGLLTLEHAPRHPALASLHALMDSWRGLGFVVAALDRQGFRVMLSKIGPGEWRAQFHSDAMVSASGFGVSTTPWRAVQMATAAALSHSDV